MERHGPLQLIVFDFENAVLPNLVHAQIDDLRRRRLIRLLDSVVAMKSSEDELIILNTLDAPRGDPLWSGLLAQTLFGSAGEVAWTARLVNPEHRSVRLHPEYGVTEDQLLEIADLIPTNARALLMLIEHLWASELEVAAAEADGHVLASCWIGSGLISQLLERSRPLFS
jgi:uncharacterized membrane protein